MFEKFNFTHNKMYSIFREERGIKLGLSEAVQLYNFVNINRSDPFILPFFNLSEIQIGQDSTENLSEVEIHSCLDCQLSLFLECTI